MPGIGTTKECNKNAGTDKNKKTKKKKLKTGVCNGYSFMSGKLEELIFFKTGRLKENKKLNLSKHFSH